MKEAIFELEFTMPVLANGTGSSDEKDTFQKDAAGALIFHQSWFFSAFSKAIGYAKAKSVKPGDISMDLIVHAPVSPFRRKYGEDQYRTHEAIMPGTTVKFEAMVADHITESVLKEILDKMGKYVGISPFGHSLGFGRFNVVSVKVEPGA